MAYNHNVNGGKCLRLYSILCFIMMVTQSKNLKKELKMQTNILKISCALLFALICLTSTQSAFAFCGTYLSDANEPLFNDATQVALMRSGTTTVLSMANTYEGPVKDFAMVVPVPVVLQQDKVKTLEPEVFERLDRYSAPRLVAYKEKNPCDERYIYQICREPNERSRNSGCSVDDVGNNDSLSSAPNAKFEQNNDSQPPLVTVKAEFAVGEYDIVILSAEDSTSLQTWLTQNNYKVPEAARPILMSYIQQGMYFFVAKINAAKVKYDKGRALLSPLRFQYESEQFSLPVRLGMVNSKGKQDLIVHILADNKRYEVANYPNALIPTNINVKASVADNYADFYEGLFAKTVRDNPKAVVTEYAWGGGPLFQGFGGKCDPCPPEPELPPTANTPVDFNTLGGDVINPSGGFSTYVVTRLHARYGKDDISEDLVFKAAPALIGGTGSSGNNHTSTYTVERPETASTFQGRYIIHKRWSDNAVMCDDPVRYRWGADVQATPQPSIGTRGVPLAMLPVQMDFDLKNYTDDVPDTQSQHFVPCESQEGQGSCAQGITRRTSFGTLALFVIGLVGLRLRRRQKGASHT